MRRMKNGYESEDLSEYESKRMLQITNPDTLARQKQRNATV